jgi:hypothetical protein
MAAVAAVEGSDLDRYRRASKRVDLSSVEWDLIHKTPLPEDHARCLTYMMDIETHTAVFLRDLLATRAGLDPDVSAFLSCWAYEEVWHGEAFSRFLGESGYKLGPDHEVVHADDAYPTRQVRTELIRRAIGRKGYVSHVTTLVGSALFKDFVAIHMTWGAANELTTLSAYHRLIRQDGTSPVGPDAAGDHQGRAAALRVLPDASQAAAPDPDRAPDHSVVDGAPLGTRRHRSSAAVRDGPRRDLPVR